MSDLWNQFTALAVSIMTLFVTTTVLMLVVKLLVPVVGDMLWRGYWHLLRLLIVLPFRLIGLALRSLEAARQRRE